MKNGEKYWEKFQAVVQCRHYQYPCGLQTMLPSPGNSPEFPEHQPELRWPRHRYTEQGIRRPEF